MGIQYEGEEAPEATPQDLLALRAWRLLGNGMGGIDWAGLPIVAELLGVTDPERLIEQLLVIRAHKPPQDKTED